MSKIGSKQTSSLLTRPFANNVKLASTTTTNQAVLSINVNQDMAQQQAKKKRAALENISNSNVTNFGQQQQQTALSNCSNLNNGKEINKKSRFGGTSNVNVPLPSLPAAATNNKLKKSDSLTRKASSKENLNAILPNKKVGETKQTKSNVKQAQQLIENSKLSKSANSIANLKSESLDIQDFSKNTAQILEPQMKPAESNEKLSGSNSSLNNLSEKSACGGTPIDEDRRLVMSAESILGWEDIDAEDKDEFSCSDYVSYIFKYYKEREERFVVDDYLKRQPSLNKQMRLLLVDWMVEVQQQLEFNHEVLYLSVKLLDLYLNKRRIEKEKLQLLGGAVMFIACKFEERMPPIIDDFIYVSDNAYDRNELIKMEIDILKTVKFDIGIPLSYTFLRRYSKCIKADMRFLTLARYILELSLQDYNFAYVSDSLKACAALYLALKMTVAYENNVKNLLASTNQECIPIEQLIVSSANLTSTEWNPTLIHYTGSFLADFVHLLPNMNNLIKTAAMSKYKTIFKKYSHQVFYEVAKIPPLSDGDVDLVVENAAKQVISY